MLVTDTSGSMNATDVAPDAPGRGPVGRQALPRSRAGRAADRPRRLRDGPHTVLPPDAGPRRGRDHGRRAARRGRDRDRRRARQRRSARSASAARTARRPRSCCSPTARRPAATRPRSRARRGPQASRSTPSRSARPPASSSRAGRCSPSPPDPEALRRGRRSLRRRAFAAEDADALDEVYERSAPGSARAKEKREVSAGFAAAGLLLLGGAGSPRCAGAGGSPSRGPASR